MNEGTSEALEARLERLYGYRRFGMKPGLDTTRRLLAALGEPHRRFSSIHIAGTNGKGSVAAMLSSILHRAGIRVGRYTSPHLVRFNERIVVDERPLSDEELLVGFDRVDEVAKGGPEPTFFEFGTVLAFHEFARKGVEWAVVETGMGGRWDATNVLSPALSVITTISLEHQQYLGNTLREIASEKAGIIKPGTPVVSGVTAPEAMVVIRQKAKELDSRLYERGVHFQTHASGPDRLAYEGIRTRWADIRLGLRGGHQVENAALVLASREILEERGLVLGEAAIREGMAGVRWPGRLELLPGRPSLLLDGAHNPEAALRLAEYLEGHVPRKNLTLVLAALSDKDYREMLALLAPLAARIVTTRPRTDRALDAGVLARAVSEFGAEIRCASTVGEALDLAKRITPPEGMACVAGSLYLVGEVRKLLGLSF